jgi:hypothetical protein
VAGRLRGRVTLCVICIVHVEMRSAGFLIEIQNQGRQFVSGLTLKLVVDDFLVWASKLHLWFDDLCLKITMTVSWFMPQNQVGYGLSVAPQNRRRMKTVWDMY